MPKSQKTDDQLDTFEKQQNKHAGDSTPTQLTLKQQRKQNAVDLAELIYKIYNENCPVHSSRAQIGKNDV